jgi:FixJ family two-component response regulator
MTPVDVPTVIIVDHDALVRASIQGMLKSVSLRSEAFATRRSFCAAGGRMVRGA